MKNILIGVHLTVYITHELTSKVLVPWDKITDLDDRLVVRIIIYNFNLRLVMVELKE